MIIKVQLSQSSSDGVRRMLIYNEDRSVRIEQVATLDVIAKMDGFDKGYFPAFSVGNGELDIWFHSPQPEQNW